METLPQEKQRLILFVEKHTGRKLWFSKASTLALILPEEYYKNMSRIIYHGSDHIIEKPEFGFGKAYNDYGLGFYCTEDLQLAKEWGVSKAGDGYANIYEIDDDKLNILNLHTPRYTVLHWLSILLTNRTFDIANPLASEAKDYLTQAFSVPYEECDVIIGYRADDSYFSFAQDFINGAISVRQLSNAMRLGKLGTQYVLKSRRAFNSISYIGNEKALSSQWYPRKEERDNDARQQYFTNERIRRQRGDLYITQILDEEIGSDDKRLQ